MCIWDTCIHQKKTQFDIYTKGSHFIRKFSYIFYKHLCLLGLNYSWRHGREYRNENVWWLHLSVKTTASILLLKVEVNNQSNVIRSFDSLLVFMHVLQEKTESYKDDIMTYSLWFKVFFLSHNWYQYHHGWLIQDNCRWLYYTYD